MHPPLPATSNNNNKTYYRRQPLQQIQQSNTNTINENENNNNKADYEQVLVKQTRALKVSNKTDGSSVLQANNSKASSGILLANIVSGNYSRVATNNENDKSKRVGTTQKTQHNYSQENVAPKETRSRVTGGSKYVSGRASGGAHNGMANGSRYGTQSQYYGSGYAQPRYGARRHTSYHVEATNVINKDDLRYTAKYWTASDNETKPVVVENNQSTSQDQNTNQQQQDSSANSTNTSTTSSNSSYSSIVDNSHNKDSNDAEQKRVSIDVSALLPKQAETSSCSTSPTASTSHRSNKSQASQNQRIAHTSQSSKNTTKSQLYKQRTSRHHSSHHPQVDTDVKQQQQVATDSCQQQQEAGSSNSSHKDGLRGIDLRNHAGVVIVDYLPESSVPGNASDLEDEAKSAKELDDGFQQVMTKKKRKEMKVAAAAAAAASSVLVSTRGKKATGSYGNSRSRRVSFNGDSKTRHGNGSNQERGSTAHTKPKTILSRSSSIQPASNATTKPGAQKYNQVVNNTQATTNKDTNQNLNAAATSTKTSISRILNATSEQNGGTISPSVDLNLKIESCKKVWSDMSNRNKSQNKETTKPRTNSIAVALINPSKAPVTDQMLTDTVIKDVLEPLIKSPVQPLMSIATSGSRYVAFGTTTASNLIAPIQSLNDSGSSAPVSNQSTCSNSGAYLDVYKTSNSSTVSSSKETIKIPSPCHKDSPETVISAAITSNVCNSEYTKTLPASPSPSVSSYLSMPSLSNNSFYQPPSATMAQTQPPVAPQQQQKLAQPQVHVQSETQGNNNNNSQQMYQSYYNPFSSYQTPQLFSQESQMTGAGEDYSQQVLKCQEQYFQQQSSYNQSMQIQTVPLQPLPPAQQQPQQQQLYQQGFPSIHSTDQHQQQQYFNPSANQHCERFHMAPETTYNPEFSQSTTYHQSNNTGANSYQHSTATLVTSANAYNPFSSNPFTTQRSNTNSDSNTSFCYSVNNFQKPSTEADSKKNMIQQQNQQSSMNTTQKNSNSNLYSLFSLSNSSTNFATSSLPTNAKNQFYNGFNTNINFQQQSPQITPSTSFGHLTAFNHTHRNSPDCFQPKSFDAATTTTTGFNRPMPMNNKNSIPLLDRVPSFDNGIVANNPYLMGGNFNQPMNPDNQFTLNHNQKNSNFFNNHNKSGLPGLCNINKMFNVFHENSDANSNNGYTNNANKENNNNYYNQMNSSVCQQQQYANTNQPPLLSRPNFQSPLLPQPPQLAPVPYQQPMQQLAPMMIGGSVNLDHFMMGNTGNARFNQQRYQIPNNIQQRGANGTYGKGYGSSSTRQARANHVKNVQQSTVKVTPPPKPVKKITILPKPKNTSNTANGISNKPTATEAATESAASKLDK